MILFVAFESLFSFSEAQSRQTSELLCITRWYQRGLYNLDRRCHVPNVSLTVAA